VRNQVKVSHASAEYAGMPAPVTFDPPMPVADAPVPACPACGEGTVFLWVCGRCGRTDTDGRPCCGQYPLVRGAYVSVLVGNHSWLGCPLITG
jgi:hypothetical protein